MTANIETNNNVNSNTVSPVSVQVPSEPGNLQGRRIINTTEKVNAIRKEFEKTHRSNWRLMLGVGAAMCIAGVVGLVASAILAPWLVGGPIMFIMSGGVMAINALTSNNENKIAMTNNEKFLAWAEENHHELDVSNIEKHHFNYIMVEEKLREERRSRELANLSPEYRIAMHNRLMIEVEMSRLRANSASVYHI